MKYSEENRMSYKVYVISEPYHYYDKKPQVKSIMSEIFTNQLRGYKAYYPPGTCPINEYDFFTNHVAITDTDSGSVLCSFKVMELMTCKKYKKEFPISAVIGKQLDSHNEVVNKWLEAHPVTGYNHGWTMNPDMTKEQRKELVDIGAAMMAAFYRDRSIENVIDISIMPFKIHLLKEWMGNRYLDLPPFEVREYGNQLGCIMVNEGLKFSEAYNVVIDKYSNLWNERDEFKPEILEVDIDEAA